MESGQSREIEKRLRASIDVIDGRPLDAGGLRSKTDGHHRRAALHATRKSRDLVAKAETEQSDYRRQPRINVFFSPEKHHHFFTLTPRWLGFLGLKEDREIGLRTSVYVFNSGILVVTSCALLGLLHFVLKRQLRTRGV